MSETCVQPRPEACGARYDMGFEEIQELAKDFLETNPPQGDERFVCYRVNGWNEMANLARGIEATVFKEKFGNTPDFMHQTYGPYESASEFLITFDRKNQAPVGALRIIKPSKDRTDPTRGLMTLRDMQSGELRSARRNRPVSMQAEDVVKIHGIEDLEECWDVGTVAVLPQYRGAMAGVQLYRGLYVLARTHGIKHFVSMIDQKPLKQMTRLFHIPFVPLGKTPRITYLDSKATQAVYGYLPDFIPTMKQYQQTMVGKILTRLIRPQMESLTNGARVDNTMQFPIDESLTTVSALKTEVVARLGPDCINPQLVNGTTAATAQALASAETPISTTSVIV